MCEMLDRGGETRAPNFVGSRYQEKKVGRVLVLSKNVGDVNRCGRFLREWVQNMKLVNTAAARFGLEQSKLR